MSHFKKHVLSRDVTTEECHWLTRDFKKGETVYEYYGHTYGCIGPGGIPVSEEPDTNPFFELPSDALVDGWSRII